MIIRVLPVFMLVGCKSSPWEQANDACEGGPDTDRCQEVLLRHLGADLAELSPAIVENLLTGAYHLLTWDLAELGEGEIPGVTVEPEIEALIDGPDGATQTVYDLVANTIKNTVEVGLEVPHANYHPFWFLTPTLYVSTMVNDFHFTPSHNASTLVHEAGHGWLHWHDADCYGEDTGDSDWKGAYALEAVVVGLAELRAPDPDPNDYWVWRTDAIECIIDE